MRSRDRVDELRKLGADARAGNGFIDADAHVDSVFSQDRPAVPESVAVLRVMVAEFATRAGLSEAMIDKVKLAVSEAATNVVVHAYRNASEPGLIALEAVAAAGELRVSVADTGPGLQPQQDSPGLGLGLAIIAQLTDDLELLRGEHGGLCVLMRFAPPGC
jgi:anti-sigma regulatory factor (Ser/Thr protein kinase)